MRGVGQPEDREFRGGVGVAVNFRSQQWRGIGGSAKICAGQRCEKDPAIQNQAAYRWLLDYQDDQNGRYLAGVGSSTADFARNGYGFTGVPPMRTS